MPLDEVDMGHVRLERHPDELAQTACLVAKVVENTYTLVHRRGSSLGTQQVGTQSRMQGEAVIGSLVCRRDADKKRQRPLLLENLIQLVETVVVCDVEVHPRRPCRIEMIKPPHTRRVGVVVFMTLRRETRHDDGRRIRHEPVASTYVGSRKTVVYTAVGSDAGAAACHRPRTESQLSL